MKRIFSIAIFIGLLAYCFPLFAATIRVPADYFTIQAAIDAAVNGDVVIVADGTYRGIGNKNLDFNGKGVTVKSLNGPENCIIDCENDGRGFNFHSGESALAIVKGFTIKNGRSTEGGAIFCGSESSPTISDCFLTNNSAMQGAGIYCNTGSPYIKDCTISENIPLSSSDGGAGIFCNNSSAIITRCTINRNKAGNGSGICINGGSATVIGCSLVGNQAVGYPSYGGGIHCAYTSSTISGCSIIGNEAGHGGGISCFGGSPTISSCVFNNNRATQIKSQGGGGGGAIWCGREYFQDPTTAIINNCVFNGNQAGHGGAISCDGASITVTNCTVRGNSASSSPSAGFYCIDSSPSVKNCIFWADSPVEIWVASGSPVFQYCNVQGGWTGVGNLDIDPAFFDASAGNYRLNDNSFCIGAGTSTGAPAKDIVGNPRPSPPGSYPDMGAYENPRALPAASPPDIFAMEVGNEWIYEGTKGGNRYTVERKVSMDSSTFPILTYAHEIKENGLFAGREYYTKSSGQVLLWGATIIDEGTLYDLKFSNGLPVFWFPVLVGDHKYSSTTGVLTQFPTYTFNVSMDVLVQSQETVDLGFDTLEAYKVRYEMRVWGLDLDMTETFTWWVVPYIGVIKEEDAESVGKLTSFAIGSGTISDQTDADRDGLKDYQELIKYKTDWLDADTDNDRFKDGEEVARGTDPNDADSHPTRAIPWLLLLLEN